MNKRQAINIVTGDIYFWIEQLSSDTPLDDFSCIIDEYNDYSFDDALRSQNDHIALTWLLRERTSGSIAAYMSLIADASYQCQKRKSTISITLSRLFPQ